MNKLENQYKNVIKFRDLDFEGFCEATSYIPDSLANRHFMSQHQFFTGMPDTSTLHVFSFEDLKDGVLSTWLKNKGVMFDNMHNVNESSNIPQQTLSLEMQEHLRTRYRNDFELYGKDYERSSH